MGEYNDYSKNDLAKGVIFKKNSLDPFQCTSSTLEKAIKASRDGNYSPLDNYRLSVIQSIIFSENVYYPVQLRDLEVLGLDAQKIQQLKQMASDFCRTVSPSELNYQLVANNLAKFFDFLNLRNLLNRKLSVFSFGCAKAPEALALETYFGEKLAEFKGFDKNQQLIEEAQREVDQRIDKYSREKFSFSTQDLSKRLPEGNPDLIIIRHPNIFHPSDKRCENPSGVWQKILTEARKKYPNAMILITTLTEEEAKACCKFLSLEESSIQTNPHKTDFEINFLNYGIFRLPVAADQYYILV